MGTGQSGVNLEKSGDIICAPGGMMGTLTSARGQKKNKLTDFVE
jgi:hypothetical protein